MANENKTKKTEAAVQDAPKGEKSAPQFPVLKDGRWVCSDGVAFKDAYLARQHEQKLK